ncbi:VanZ family protein [Campylobacter sp. 9BO]|uniref:VanZ family protein n=1 Tax=Campylobacter sp. 9BO TaxID=3424759 RepID=UPI003D348436
MRVKFARFLFFICLFAIEFLATTSRSILVVENSWDKANHFLAFGALYILLSLGWRSGLFAKFYIKFCVLLAFGVQIELVQSMLPNRYFSLLDIFADIIGIFFGVFAFWVLRKIFYHFIKVGSLEAT